MNLLLNELSLCLNLIDIDYQSIKNRCGSISLETTTTQKYKQPYFPVVCVALRGRQRVCGRQRVRVRGVSVYVCVCAG